MWIVRNVLRGALYIDDLDVKIPPKEYFDLDDLGRDKVEASSVIKLALDEGYLQNIKKDESQAKSTAPLPEPDVDGREELAAIEERLRDMQELISRGFNLSQIEARLNVLQEEMADSGAYSERLQSLIHEFRNTLLVRPPQPAPQPVHVPMQHYAPPQPQPAARRREDDRSLSDGQAEIIKERMNTILESLHSLQHSMLVQQQATAQAGARMVKKQGGAKPAAASDASRELDKLISDVQSLRSGLQARPKPEEVVSPDGLSDELSDFRALLLNDFRRLLSGLPKAAPTEDRSLGNAEDMTESELRARMAVLTEKESDIKSNFNQIGKITEGDGGAQSMADLLCDI